MCPGVWGLFFFLLWLKDVTLHGKPTVLHSTRRFVFGVLGCEEDTLLLRITSMDINIE